MSTTRDNTWYCCNLGDAMLAAPALDNIQAQVVAASANDVIIDECAVFYRHESEGRLHCELVVYFSPQAARMPIAANLRPCAKPAKQGLSLLLGTASSWSILFPEV